MEHVTFRVVDYSTAEVRELNADHPEECVAFEGRDSPTWIMVTGLHDTEKIQKLLTAYEIHPLIQQDILNTEHHPKVDDFGNYLFITTRQISLTGTETKFEAQQFSMILTDRVLISFHEAPSTIFDPVIARLRDGKGKLRTAGVDYLAWALLDAVMDHYLLALDLYEDEISALDERLASNDMKVTMQHIHAIRAQTNFLYRAIRPMREVAIALQRNEGPLLSQPLQPFIRDLYDHAWHAIETADHLREAITAIREFYQANLAQRMNEIMKVLTALSTIFLPLSFLAGVWGMNFDHMEELHWLHGYRVAWSFFLGVALLMLWYFKRKRWL